MDQNETQETNGAITPPYLPYKTFTNFIESLRVGIPERIHRSVMFKLSGATQSMLIGALRYFSLIDENGIPGPRLEPFVSASPEDRKKQMLDLLRMSYSFMFTNINLERAIPKTVHDAFATAYPKLSSETLRKSEVFFLSAAKDVGIQLSQYLTTRQSRGGGRQKTTITPKPGALNAEGQTPRAETSIQERTDYQMLIDILDPDTMEEEEQKAVWTLIRYLKRQQKEEA